MEQFIKITVRNTILREDLNKDAKTGYLHSMGNFSSKKFTGKPLLE